MKLIVHTDGGCPLNGKAKNPPASAAYVMYLENGEHVASQAKLLTGSNNVAEYHGIGFAALALPEVLATLAERPAEVEFRCDSMLVVCQMKGEWKIKDPEMAKLANACRKLLGLVGIPYTFTWVPREENKEADFLCNLAFDGKVKEDMFAALPRPSKDKKDKKPTTGQLFRALGKLSTARAMKVDPQGFALCTGCDVRLLDCVCEELESELNGIHVGLELPAGAVQPSN